MKKIGIVTLNGYFNYGNRLQNYALQEAIKSLNTDVETIRLDRFATKKTNFSSLVRSFYQNIKNSLRDTEQKSEMNREKIFKEFSHNYITETVDEYDINGNINFLNDEYDYCVIGSDQVWNPHMNQGSKQFFGQFLDAKKRVAYSPSFGISNLPDENISNYKKWINEIPSLSVREQEGANIIKELTGRDAEVLVDPTMLLDKEQWLDISKSAENKPNKPYILTYFLGGPTGETREKIYSIAEKNNMEIINLGDITEVDTYETGPSEFLDYINNASAFFTDSYHGVVFSLIFKTPFLVYKRIGGESMYSRIDTILENFNYKNREANGFKEEIFSMDFTGTDEVLQKEYERSMNYLKEALEIEE